MATMPHTSGHDAPTHHNGSFVGRSLVVVGSFVGRSVGCSQNSLTCGSKRLPWEHPQVNEGSTHSRSVAAGTRPAPRGAALAHGFILLLRGQSPEDAARAIADLATSPTMPADCGS